jgi:hypothetical protein
MAITLTEVLDGNGNIVADGNTYATIAYADARFLGRDSVATWDAANDDTQARAMLDAMELLRGKPWIGGRLSETQPEDWPRAAVRPAERRSNRLIRTGYETLTGATGGLYDAGGKFWASTVIPTPIKDAQCDLAYLFVTDDFRKQDQYSSIVTKAGSTTLTKRTGSELLTSGIPRQIFAALKVFLMSGVELSR